MTYFQIIRDNVATGQMTKQDRINKAAREYNEIEYLGYMSQARKIETDASQIAKDFGIGDAWEIHQQIKKTAAIQ